MYIIVEYNERYKPYDKSGNDLKQPAWVKLPAKPKGDGLETLLEYPRGLEIFAVWCLLLEKTTIEKDPENRGKLLNHKGLPASVSEIAKSISLPSRSRFVGIAINTLIEIGWVGRDGVAEVTSADSQKTSPKSRVEKSRVEKSNYTPDFEIFWKAFKGRWNPDKNRHDKVGKLEAFEEWKKLTEDQRAKAVKAAPLTGSEITKDACRWLKYHRWEDFESDPKSKPPVKKPQPKSNSPPITAEQRQQLRKKLDQTIKQFGTITQEKMILEQKARTKQ